MKRSSPESYYNIPLNEARVFSKRFGKLYAEGQAIDSAYILLCGEVTLCGRNPEGKKVAFHKANIGEVLGVQALQNAGKSTHSALVNKASKFMAIPLASIHIYIEQIPNFRNRLAHQLIGNLDLIENIIGFS